MSHVSYLSQIKYVIGVSSVASSKTQKIKLLLLKSQENINYRSYIYI